MPPFVVSRIPIIGHFIAFTKPIDMIRENYLRYGSVFSMNMMGQCLTFLIGPEAHEAFFRASDEDLSQAKVYGFMTPVFGKGVVYDTTKERTLYVKGYPLDDADVTIESVAEEFKGFGKIQYVRLRKDPGTKKFKGSVFVEYDNKDSVGAAVKAAYSSPAFLPSFSRAAACEG